MSNKTLMREHRCHRTSDGGRHVISFIFIIKGILEYLKSHYILISGPVSRRSERLDRGPHLFSQTAEQLCGAWIRAGTRPNPKPCRLGLGCGGGPESPARVLSACGSHRHTGVTAAETQLRNRAAAAQSPSGTEGGGGRWIRTGRGHTGLRQLTGSSSLRHLASDWTRMESPVVAVRCPNAATAGPVRFCEGRPGDTAAGPGRVRTRSPGQTPGASVRPSVCTAAR